MRCVYTEEAKKVYQEGMRCVYAESANEVYQEGMKCVYAETAKEVSAGRRFSNTPKVKRPRARISQLHYAMEVVPPRS